MILRALNQYQGATALPPGYARKPVGFLLTVLRGASDCRLEPLYTMQVAEGAKKGAKPRMMPAVFEVPDVTRTRRITPFLGCDNAAYVLGLPKEETDETARAKARQDADARHEAFCELVATFARESADVTASAYLEWDQAGRPGLLEAIERLNPTDLGRLATDRIAIRLEGRRGQLHDSVAAREFWTRHAMADREGEESPCLCCGLLRPAVPTIPQFLTGARIPGATQANVALLSANFASANRGASGTGLRSAPVCAECAAGAVNAFNALTAHDDHRWTDRGTDQAMIWWASEEQDFMTTIGAPSAEAVRALVASIRAGAEVGQYEEVSRFYALTFSGNVARLVIRDWLDVPLARARASALHWFADTGTPALRPDTPSGEAVHLPLRDLVSACAPLDGSVPDGVFRLLLRAALLDAPLPRDLLTRVLRLMRADIHRLQRADSLTAYRLRERGHAHFALLRLALNRSLPEEMHVDSHLDLERDDSPYLHGRLFAVREALQYQALGDVNASIADRYLDRASLDPSSVERTLGTLAHHHLKALLRKKGRDAYLGASRRVTNLSAMAGQAPGRMPAEQQAAWLAGYYQQRQADFAAAAAAKKARETKTETEDAQ